MKQSERFQALSLFTTVHGIGPTTARTLYDRGLRSFRDLEAYYEVDTGYTPTESSESTDMDIRIALRLRDDFMRTCGLPARTRVKTLVLTARTVYRAKTLKPSMPRSWTILTPWSPVVSVPLLAGMSFIGPIYFFLFFSQIKLRRYRRGKPESNDIDIVFTHPNAKSAKTLSGRLLERLRSAGLVTQVMREYRLTPALRCPQCMLMLLQTSPDSSSTVRYALLSGTRSRRHSLCTEHPTTVGTAAST